MEAYALLSSILRRLHLAVQPIVKFPSCPNSYPHPTGLDRAGCSKGKIIERSTTDGIKPCIRDMVQLLASSPRDDSTVVSLSEVLNPV